MFDLTIIDDGESYFVFVRAYSPGKLIVLSTGHTWAV
jgi:hypothetical protein